jgi:hypothetical protein
MSRAIVVFSSPKWLSLLALVLFFGCTSRTSNRPPTYPVTGTVTLNGKAVDGAVVTFQPMEGKGSAIGSTDSTGSYALSTFGPGDGAQVGQYKVSIAKYDAPVTPPAGGSRPGEFGAPGLPDDYVPPTIGGGAATKGNTGPKNLLPAKYADFDSSALRATVDKGPNKFDFELK